MARHRVLLTSLLSVLIVALAACGAASPTPAPTSAPTSAPAATATPVPAAEPTLELTAVPETGPDSITLTDDAGTSVEVAQPVERIVSLAPSNTEIVFALGLGERLVGVTDFCDYPAAALEIEKVGGIEPNLERIVALDPDLVLTIGGGPTPPGVAQLRELGLAVLVLDPNDLQTVYHDIELVGQATGAEQEAAVLVGQMQQRIAAVEERTAAVTERPLVFYELDATDPTRPWTSGAGSWHDMFIQLVGGSNLAGSQESAWVQLNAEEIIAQNPDIIVLGDALWGVSPESVGERPGWETIAAVQNGRVYPIDDNLISRPGPRVADGIEALARLIHPELFE